MRHEVHNAGGCTNTTHQLKSLLFAAVRWLINAIKTCLSFTHNSLLENPVSWFRSFLKISQVSIQILILRQLNRRVVNRLQFHNKSHPTSTSKRFIRMDTEGSVQVCNIALVEELLWRIDRSLKQCGHSVVVQYCTLSNQFPLPCYVLHFSGLQKFTKLYTASQEDSVLSCSNRVTRQTNCCSHWMRTVTKFSILWTFEPLRNW